ncbi:hypothetical protein [Dactylosporangium sp. CA-233914]|uniref:hypothetical protein n=1 Tax=Dactylosporangium sp. CA-233914 TaxID=3239934 RepID=UPI003D8C9DE3
MAARFVGAYLRTGDLGFLPADQLFEATVSAGHPAIATNPSPPSSSPRPAVR